jgi:hypothetical protein
MLDILILIMYMLPLVLFICFVVYLISLKYLPPSKYRFYIAGLYTDSIKEALEIQAALRAKGIDKPIINLKSRKNANKLQRTRQTR